MSALKKLETLDLSIIFLFENVSTSSILKSLTALKSLKSLLLREARIAGPLPVHGILYAYTDDMQNIDAFKPKFVFHLKKYVMSYFHCSELSLLQNLETLDLGGSEISSPSTTAGIYGCVHFCLWVPLDCLDFLIVS